MLPVMLHSLLAALTPKLLLLNLIGTALGVLIGALPGLTATMGVALVVPLTFGLPPTQALTVLMGLYIGAIQGGSIPAVLINTPGTPAATATCIDGYVLSQRGQAGKALGMSMMGSWIGTMVGWVILVTVAPVLANFALRFSAPEYFALALFGLTIIVTLSADSLTKGLIAGAVGLLLAMVGMDPITGVSRFTLGSVELMSGVSFIPAMIGLFAVSEAFNSIEKIVALPRIVQSLKGIIPPWRDIKRCIPVYLRSSLIGTFIGALPGAGADIAAFVSYSEAKRWSKHPDEFGKGSLEGVAAPETGANAVCAGAMIPLLTLGVPGDSVTAILLGALMVQGLRPGATLFTEQAGVIWTVFFGMLVANALTLIVGMSGAPLFARAISIPRKYLVPIILLLCTVGSYVMRNSATDILVMLVFGLAGYLGGKMGIPSSPVVLALILGPMAEENFRRALVMSHGNYGIFATRPISGTLLAISLVSVALPVWQRYRKSRGRQAAMEGDEP